MIKGYNCTCSFSTWSLWEWPLYPISHDLGFSSSEAHLHLHVHGMNSQCVPSNESMGNCDAEKEPLVSRLLCPAFLFLTPSAWVSRTVDAVAPPVSLSVASFSLSCWGGGMLGDVSEGGGEVLWGAERKGRGGEDEVWGGAVPELRRVRVKWEDGRCTVINTLQRRDKWGYRHNSIRASERSDWDKHFILV